MGTGVGNAKGFRLEVLDLVRIGALAAVALCPFCMNDGSCVRLCVCVSV